MKPKEFIHVIDDTKVIAAIEAAEARSTGEIRLVIAHQNVPDALAAAKDQFARLSMHQTRRRNAVLLYFAPKSQHFAIYADVGLHEKCGQEFWQAIVDEMTPMLKQGKITEAIVQAVDKVGEVLARHFPPEPGDQNELPNQVARE